MQKLPFHPEQFFAALKKEILRGEMENREIELCNMLALSQVYIDMNHLLPDAEAQLILHPAFKSGSARLKIEVAKFSGGQITHLRSALKKCSAFEVSPLTSGKMNISSTVKGVFK